MPDWTEKYRPERLEELRGNDSAVAELREWTEAWPAEGRAVVLAGSPGIGKTSAAHALAAEMGWEAIEVNASDSRKEEEIRRLVGRGATNYDIVQSFETAAAEQDDGGDPAPQLLIVDEADSFHGNVDRGGASAIAEIAREAEQPMVLIVNDEYEMPDSLRRNLDTIEFRDVSKRSILPVLRNICREEGITYDDEAVETIAEQNSGDLRGAINDLQAVAGDGELAAGDVTTGDRDRTTDIFSFLDAVIKEKNAPEAIEASYAVDETPDDLVAWIEDNMPKDYSGAELAAAYRSLSAADKWLGRVRATQNYSYWRYAAGAATAGVAAAREEPKGGWTRYGPPSYWSKLGRSRSSREIRDYVARRIAQSHGTSIATARRDILPFLAAMTHHCRNRELTVAMAAAYDLEAEHVAFVTGSGEDTNKVQSIVEDARDRQAADAVEATDGAFEGSPEETETAEAGDGDDETDSDGSDEPTDDAKETEESGRQAGLSDF